MRHVFNGLAAGVNFGAFLFGCLVILRDPEGASRPLIWFVTLAMLWGALELFQRSWRRT